MQIALRFVDVVTTAGDDSDVEHAIYDLAMSRFRARLLQADLKVKLT